MNFAWLPLSSFAVMVMSCAIVVSAAEERSKAKPVPLVGMIALIVKEPVQKELGIEPDSQELAEIKEILKPFSQVLQQRLNRPTEDDRGLTAQSLYARIESEFVSKLKLQLKPEQFRRLQEIHWQRWGIRSLEDGAMAEALALTDDQIEKIAVTKTEMENRKKELEKQRRDRKRQGENTDEFPQKFLELDGELGRRYREILTSDQFDRFTELKGAAFELVETSAPANRSSGMPVATRPGGLMSLAVMEPVMNELGLDPTSPAVAELHKLSRAHSLELRQRLQSKESGVDVREAARDVESKLQTKYDVELKAVLTPDQFTRLRQIHWQRLGADAFSDGEVTRLLQITSEQQAQLATLNLEVFQKVRQLLNPPGGGRPVGASVSDEIKKQIQNSVTDREARIQQILTTTQQEQWTKLKGKPFDLETLRKPVP